MLPFHLIGRIIRSYNEKHHHSVQPSEGPILTLRNVILPQVESAAPLPICDVTCVDGKVSSIDFADHTSSRETDEALVPEEVLLTANNRKVTVIDGERALLFPSLCHAHVHLDKCFLLESCDELVNGDFPEALEVTAKAKSGFSKNIDDLYHRGRRLIVESVECGVTVMRAHVEVDTTVHYNCLKVALRLKREFEDICYVQIAVFAQDPLFADAFATEHSENFALLHGAAQREGVEAVGSAPYVEPTVLHAKRNIGLILDLAYDRGLHADFHLDYNVDPTSEPLIWHVLEQLRERIQADRWRPDAHVCIGHATRLTLFTDEEWTRFDTEVREGNLPVTLVGLPPSDMYMMGRGLSPVPRTTLNIPRLAHKHGIKAAMSVNNVENAFTPQGPVDPLALCPMGVALFQCGTKKDCLSLVEAITLNSRAAIGAATPKSLIPAKGDKADFVLLHGNESLYSAALNPSFSRTTIKDGRVVAKRRACRWILESQSNGHPRQSIVLL